MSDVSPKDKSSPDYLFDIRGSDEESEAKKPIMIGPNRPQDRQVQSKADSLCSKMHRGVYDCDPDSSLIACYSKFPHSGPWDSGHVFRHHRS